MPLRGGEGGRTPNGKCHLKFPFWLSAPLPKFATIKTKICPKGKNSVFSMLKSTSAWKKVVTNKSYECRQLMMVFFVSIYQVPDWFWRTFFWHFEAKTNWEPWQLPRWFWSLQFKIQLCKCASIVSEFVLYKKEFFTIMKMLRWPTS